MLLVNKFFYRKGGAETVFLEERNFLIRAGVKVFDLAQKDDRNLESAYSDYFVSSKDYYSSSPLEKIMAAGSLVYSREAVKKIAKIIDDCHPDVMHCHNIYHQLTPAIIGQAKRKGVPVVLTVHDYKPVCPVYNRLRHGTPCSLCLDGDFSQVVHHRCADDSLSRSLLLYVEAIVQRWLRSYEQVDRFLVPSHFMFEALSRRFSKDRLAVLYNGTDTESVALEDTDDGFVLYSGRISPEKGVQTLLEAHRQANTKWRLIVAGTGPDHMMLAARYPEVEFRGHLNDIELKGLIARAAVIVVPSEWFENCPMSILEAMAHAKPVVAANIGGIPELVIDKVTGILFNSKSIEQLSDAIQLLINDSLLRKKMGRAARLRAEKHFSLRSHNDELLAHLRSVSSAVKPKNANRDN